MHSDEREAKQMKNRPLEIEKESRKVKRYHTRSRKGKRQKNKKTKNKEWREK